MKLRSELQRHLFNNYSNIFLPLLGILLVSFLSVEYSIPLLILIFIWIFYRRRSGTEVSEKRVRILERLKIDSDSNLVLINYNGCNHLIFANRNCVIKITEERENVQSQ
ncbi:MAG: hypothetical protein ACP5QK_09685 [Myxococcota bacterium]